MELMFSYDFLLQILQPSYGSTTIIQQTHHYHRRSSRNYTKKGCKIIHNRVTVMKGAKLEPLNYMFLRSGH